ncbi:heparan-alpha-glucosaminide N-acetyltransferase domain-containing protein [Streptomyces sp. S6]
MTDIDGATKAPLSPQPAADPTAETSPRVPVARLVGVDLARAIAVIGMFSVHVGPFGGTDSAVANWFLELAGGRASALFAMLAGFSLTLIAGRPKPKEGLAFRQAKARILIRAAVLLVVGTALAMTNFGGAGILNFYALYFVLSLPLLRLPARKLAAVALVLALVTPQLNYGLRLLLSESAVNTINTYDPLARVSDVGVLHLTLLGLYPAITWMTFVVTGMAVGRLDLTSWDVRKRLAAVAAGMIAFGYGVSWLLLKATGGAKYVMSEGPSPEDLAKLMSDPAAAAGAFDSPVGHDLWGTQAYGLLAAVPHSGSTFDLIGALGIAITVLLCATVAMERLHWLRKALTPVIAVGTMSLTLYVGHILAILALPGEAATPPQDAGVPLLLSFIAGAILFAGVWSRFFRRGPLEEILHRATKPASSIR